MISRMHPPNKPQFYRVEESEIVVRARFATLLFGKFRETRSSPNCLATIRYIQAVSCTVCSSDWGSMMSGVCDRILNKDERIAFAMVVNEKGQIVESKMRGSPLMPTEDITTFAGIWTSVMGGVARQMQKYLGTHFGLSMYYDKLNIHGYPAGNNTVVIAARKGLAFDTLLRLQKTEEG